MANVTLKSIQFPGLDDVYTVTQLANNLTSAGKAADAKAVGDAIAAVQAAIPAVDNTLAVAGDAADSKAVGDAVTEIRSALNGIYDGKRFIPFQTSPGYITGNGGINIPTSPNNEVYTNKIAVTQGDVISLSLNLAASNSMWLSYATYDSSNVFTNRITLVDSVTQQSYTGTIVIPSGVSYIAFTYRTFTGADFKSFMRWEIDGNTLDDNTVGFTKLSNDMKSTTRNLFNLTWERTFYDSNGNYIPATWSNTNSACPPDISVTGGEYYTISWGSHDFTGPALFYVQQFNQAKERIKYEYWDYSKGEVTVKLESNTAFIGLMQYATAAISEWSLLVPSWTQVEAGTVATRHVAAKVLSDNLLDIENIVNETIPTMRSVSLQNRPSNTVKSIAHRGDDILAPQCTAPAYIIARKLGFSIAENDLWLSEDNEFVMWHDTSLSRLGNLVDINGYLMYTDGTDYYWVDPSDDSVYTWDGEQYVASQSALSGLTRCAGADYAVNSSGGKIGLDLDVLKRIDFGVYKGVQFAGTQILTLEEWALLCKKLGMEIYIDKKLTYTDELITVAANIIKKCGMGKYASWIGLSVAQITLLRTIIPDARVGVLSHPSAENIETYASVNTGRGFFFNGDAKNGLTKEVVQLGLNAGFEVEAWYVDVSAGTTEEQILAKIQESVSFGLTGMTLDHYKVEDAFAGMLAEY